MAVTPGRAVSAVPVSAALHDGHVSRSDAGRTAEHQGQRKGADSSPDFCSSTMVGTLPCHGRDGIPHWYPGPVASRGSALALGADVLVHGRVPVHSHSI